jgi:hypothetical protein
MGSGGLILLFSYLASYAVLGRSFLSGFEDLQQDKD